MQDDLHLNYKKSYLKHKIIMYLFSIIYIVYFVYLFMTKEFNLNNNMDLIRIIGLFIIVFINGLATLTNSKLTIFLSILVYILTIGLTITTLNIKVPKIKSINKNNTNETGHIICVGKTDTSDDSKIEVTYNKDKIDRITYTYIFDIKNKTGAENLVNHFDKANSSNDNIYSEITISDNVEVKFYYNLNNADIKEIQKDNNKITDSYKEFKKNELDKLQCKTRD